MYTVNFRSNQFCDQERLKTIAECHAWIEKHFQTVENAPESFAWIQNGRKMYGIQVAGNRDMMLTNIKDRYMTMDQIWEEVETLRKISRAVNGKNQQEERAETVSKEENKMLAVEDIETEESRETIPAEAAADAEETAQAVPTFTAHSVTDNAGKSFPVTYHMYAGAVIAQILADGKTLTVTIDEQDPYYIQAFCAAQEAERIAQAEAEAEKERQKEERRAARAADPDKQAHGPVPEKSWIGETIRGLGYTIEFSATYDRTRIIFDDVPTDAAKAIVKENGFYYSPALKSWNRGLNWKAYRAALKAQEAFARMKEIPCKVKRRAA